jgi:hypothetical protein
VYRDELWRGADPAPAAERLALRAAPIFESWWAPRRDRARALLARVARGQGLGAPPAGERLEVRELVDRGLLVEGEGGLSLPGEAWRAWVADGA